MKKIMILFVIFSFNLSVSQNKKGVVIYKKEILQLMTESKKGKELSKKNPSLFKKSQIIENNAKQLLENIEFKLKFNKNESVFMVEQPLEVENNKYSKFAVGPYGSGIYYTNLKNNEYYHQLDAFGQKFLIKNSQTTWILSNEKKIISEYICFKATTKQTKEESNKLIETLITAWYTSEIPISFGPLGYGDLPGLILELEIRNEKFYFDKIIFNDKIKIKKPLKGKIVTRSEFDVIGAKALQSFKNFN